MDSMACHGGPMKVRPASVHFLANVGFSLNYTMSVFVHGSAYRWAYKAISWMYALTSLFFCNLYYSVTVEICGGVS
jgi:hypothetical protein